MPSGSCVHCRLFQSYLSCISPSARANCSLNLKARIGWRSVSESLLVAFAFPVFWPRFRNARLVNLCTLPAPRCYLHWAGAFLRSSPLFPFRGFRCSNRAVVYRYPPCSCPINVTVSQLSNNTTEFLRRGTHAGNSSDYEAVSGSTAVLPNFAFRFGFSRLFELPTPVSLP